MTVALSLQFGGLCMESSHACSYLCVFGEQRAFNHSTIICDLVLFLVFVVNREQSV